jgi:hypothetical protein
MKGKLFWVVGFGLLFSMLSSQGNTPTTETGKPSQVAKLLSIFAPKRCDTPSISSFNSIKAMLEQPSVAMNPAVINKVLNTLKCAKKHHTRHDHILTVIDYSKPSNEKRLWVFDLRKNHMLFHTYVSHGITSGTLLTQQFSNRNNSKASSLGVYKTDRAYYGRHGLSLKLAGLERGFNDNAFNRAIVMHSAWYMDEDFIKKYGRPGRSWGCPAISKKLKISLINTIKDNGLFIVYYPGEKWITHSKYLNCGKFSPRPHTALLKTALQKSDKKRTGIFFIEKNNDNKYEENEPIVVMSADNYLKTFQQHVPLTRMLRCQINDMEYIALSHDEFDILIKHNHHAFNDLFFVIPEVKKVRGYYKTEMRVINMGQIKDIISYHDNQENDYTVLFNTRPAVHLKSTHRFIRWLGL